MSQEAKVLLSIGAATVILLIGAVVFLSRGSTTTPSPIITTPLPSIDSKLLVSPTSHQTASSSAKVTVVEFGDYQCPVCGDAYPTTKQVIQNYGDKINFVFRNFPLPQHQNAQIAAEAAEAAGAQGKYWPMHDMLYEHQNDWSDASQPLSLFDSYAKSIGLNLDQFNSDVTSNKYTSVIEQDMQDGETLGVNATPTFFINGQEFVGNIDYSQFKSTIDQDLAK